MDKIIVITVLVIILLLGFSVPILAKENKKSDIASLQKLIESLKKQIEELKTKIADLLQSEKEIKETAKEIKKTLQLSQQLQFGMTSEEVKLLQEVLATDPEIYPEGLITGYFGSLTLKAVKKFQEKAGFEQVGQVGPKTLSKINELLAEGAGESGKVPPGLLVAPGIRKKLGGVVFEPLPGQVLPPGIAKKFEPTTPAVDGVTNPVDGLSFWLNFLL